ncbi:transposase [Xanthomonas oryzae]|uniref:transposase n=2 Tax=Xanthomonas oryzae TaxID=347 RepID=UPI00215CC2AD|nr:transposase [Xanthomonas oryzae]
MVRVLLLQQLYNLSDDALEYQLLDRCSVVRFVGLEGSGNVPDAKTIWVWRERLKNKHVIGDISAAIRGATGARRLHCPWWVDHRCPMPDARCPMFVIEAYRMAAFCLAQDGQREAARNYGLEAVRAAKPLPSEDRRSTTLPQTLQDLLVLQDKRRAHRIEQCAATYLQSVSTLHAQAEQQAARLGAQPSSAHLDQIESTLHAGLEHAFHRAAQERERLIQGGDEFFRKVVAVGREFLHSTWNGLPDIRHPLDNEIPAWTQPPATQPLPDPAALTQSPGAAPSVGLAGRTEATA